ncbi:expressed unknown protein [Seminavis robusta]|uniref:Uncharacterized protein n=1 Tax=Seminavis robusta TaxID=568900 RepID=A0A9N8DPP8_9STRA|nr:expressed unknown protein [Seminavis robusta]|eukprot:Sro197_g083930.1 n/a (116) ;mRNA; r:87634-87981
MAMQEHKKKLPLRSRSEIDGPNNKSRRVSRLPSAAADTSRPTKKKERRHSMGNTMLRKSMDPHEIINLLETCGQRADLDCGFDCLQTIKNTSDTKSKKSSGKSKRKPIKRSATFH